MDTSSSVLDEGSRPVRAWAETVSIPTYGTGKPEKNPLFLEKRVYQGSSGAVYPYPVIEKVLDEKGPREYAGIFLENRWLRILVLPELGGRVQMALDKTNGYHFVYFNRVVKPALVGLTGPWISGGIEFNWPQHHRPSTFLPLQWRIVENPDGSVTAWCGEIERMSRMKGMAGFTLHPDRAYLEVRVRLYNRTSEPRTFLWWANPAVHVGEHTQSIFPPDVHAVLDHGKRAVSDFPVATGVYYNVDYAPGTDISRYRNIPVPTSFMAWRSDFDFLGNYDHERRAGMLHVANHRVVPGKKQWTWGRGDFGSAWDRELTDEDGPYVELMCGAYTDNQPDFSWIMPGEEKSFSQFFFPFKEIGVVKNATKEAAVSLDIDGKRARVGVYLTGPRCVRVILDAGGRTILDELAHLGPEAAFLREVEATALLPPQAWKVRVLDGARELVCFAPLPREPHEIPPLATAARPPAEIVSIEELYLNGLHLEQYRHATYAPEAYYEEALRRDPGDSRANEALGLLLYGRGKFAEAEACLRQAAASLTRRNPNPRDGEPFYGLGLALRMQGRLEEAFDAFSKAAWNAAWQDSAYFELARLSARAGRLEEALDLASRSLSRNAHHHRARHLLAAVLRRLGRLDEATRETERTLQVDPLDLGALRERFLLTGDSTFDGVARGETHAYEEIALDYAHAGMFEEAEALLRAAPAGGPMALYYLGWILTLAGKDEEALDAFARASSAPPDFCFPNAIECVPALATARRTNPRDGRAPFYIGNFWYAHRRHEEAIASWERAREIDARFPTVHRNLALAYFNKLRDPEGARASLERAFELDPSDARVLFELDQLRKKMNVVPVERLDLLDRHPRLVDERDDLTIERVTLLNILGNHEEALSILLSRRFHPWEGGEGKATGQYVAALLLRARTRVAAGDAVAALEAIESARRYPHNLGEGKLHGAKENPIDYLAGLCLDAVGRAREAREAYERAAVGLREPSSPLYYNDQPPETILYQGLACRQLGRPDEAREVFLRLVDYGKAHAGDPVEVDYFAVSLPDFLVFDEDPGRRNRIHCAFMEALGYQGLERLDPGEWGEKAADAFARVLALDRSHGSAHLHRRIAAT